jgi:hypothetical protein
LNFSQEWNFLLFSASENGSSGISYYFQPLKIVVVEFTIIFVIKFLSGMSLPPKINGNSSFYKSADPSGPWTCKNYCSHLYLAEMHHYFTSKFFLTRELEDSVISSIGSCKASTLTEKDLGCVLDRNASSKYSESKSLYRSCAGRHLY